jgi:outer membrane protein with glycine zipper
MRTLVAVGASVIALSLLAKPASAQNMYIYPAQGQSQAQQDKDRYECHNWAVQQTGFDPTQANAGAAYNQPPPPQGGVLQGAAKGAAVGAVGGAIGGDAGKGAAIGAAAGGLIGGMRRNNQARQQQAASQQQAEAIAAQQDAYNRAFAACLTGRGYTVN